MVKTGTSRVPSPTATVLQSQPTEPRQSTAAEEANHEGPGTAPNEIGIRLAVAERNLKRRKIPYKIIGAAASGVVATRSWPVCKTNPAPRSHLESGTTLYLIVARSCK
jgi:hypothetical protein